MVCDIQWTLPSDDDRWLSVRVHVFTPHSVSGVLVQLLLTARWSELRLCVADADLLVLCSETQQHNWSFANSYSNSQRGNCLTPSTLSQTLSDKVCVLSPVVHVWHVCGVTSVAPVHHTMKCFCATPSPFSIGYSWSAVSFDGVFLWFWWKINISTLFKWKMVLKA